MTANQPREQSAFETASRYGRVLIDACDRLDLGRAAEAAKRAFQALETEQQFRDAQRQR